MNFLSLLLFSFKRSEIKYFDIANQNWTIEVLKSEHLISPVYYSLRLTKILNNGFTAKVYKTNETKDHLFSYKIIFYNLGNISFSDQNNIIYLNLTQNLNNYFTFSGSFGENIFHLFFKPKDFIRLTLFDIDNHKMLNCNIWKEKRNPRIPFYIRYFYPFTAFIIILVAKIISMWNQYRMMIAQKRLALKKRALYKSKRNQLPIDD